MPITDSVIKQVEALAIKDGMPEGLKVKSRTGKILFDSSWTAGVDYASEDDELNDKLNDELNDDELNDENVCYDIEEVNSEDDNDNDNDHNDDMADEDYLLESPGVKRHYLENNPGNTNDNNIANENDDVFENDEDDESDAENTENQCENVETAEESSNNNNDGNEIASLSPTIVTNRYPKRSPKPIDRHGKHVTHLHSEKTDENIHEYDTEECNIVAITMCHYNEKPVKMSGKSFVTTCSLNQGKREFGTREDDATCKKMGQIDKRLVFEPIKLESLTEEEKKKAIESLLFLNEKRDGTIKACACANGSTQRSFMPREEAASPTVGIDSVLITATIDAKQGRDVMVVDMPNAFAQAVLPEDEEKVIMKI